MNRKYTLFLFGTIIGLTLTGCQSGQSTQQATEAPATEAPATEAPATEAPATETSATEASATEAPATAAEDTEAVTEDNSGASETEASLEPITPSDYLVSDAADYVKLGSYEGIPVEMTTYEITDDMVQDRIQEELEMNAEEIEKDGAAADGDTVYFDLTYTEKDSGETTSEEDYYTVIGYEEFGTEFDQQLTGASAGDSLSFSIDYTEDDMLIDWAGKTIDFTVDVTSVCTLEVPDYDEDYLEKYTEYDTKEDYEASIRNALEVEYEDMSYSDTIDSLFGSALERTEFTGYPEDLYDSCKKETLDYYRAFLGDGTEEEICEMLGISADDLDADVVSAVNQKLLVSAYCLANDITVTEEEYIGFLEEYATYYGEPDAVSFEENYGRSSIVWSLYDSKFTQELYDSAEITEVPYDPSDYETEEFEPDELDAEMVEDDTEGDAAEDPEESTDAETETDASGTGDSADTETDASDMDGSADAEANASDTDGSADTEADTSITEN